MSWFARIEEACAAFIEQTFARTFPSDLEPAHIARKLVATMEARTVHEGDEAFAPVHYTVRVNEEDFERLQPHQAYLEQQWAALLEDMAQRVSIRFEGPVRVHLQQDERIVAGAVEIDPFAAQAQQPEAPKAFRLRMVKGLPVDGVFSLVDALEIGRGKSNDIGLSDPRVSRRHARIERARNHAVLEDLGSTNGTLVDGKPVRGRVALRPGSLITVGNTSLRFEETLT